MAFFPSMFRVGSPALGAPPVPFAFVQTSGLKETGSNTNLTDTLNAASNFTAGNTVIFAMTYWNANGTDCTGVTIGGVTATCDAKFQSSAFSAYRVEIWSAQGVAGGRSDVVISTAGSVNHSITGSFEEWAGIKSPAVDQFANASKITTYAISTAATTNSTDLVYAALASGDVFAGGVTIAGPTTGYTQTYLATAINHRGAAGGYKTVAATGVQTGTFTVSSGTEAACAIVAYKTN